jgi:hypothetical protein
VIPLTTGEYAGMQDALEPRLTDTCTVRRPSGTGASAGFTTVLTAVPCKVRDLTPGDLAALPGGFEAVRARAFEFARPTDVRAEDVLTTSTGAQYRVQGTTADVTDAVLLTVYAEARLG